MAGSLAPQWLFQIFDDVGNIASGAKLFSWIAGTTEPAPVYADYACTTPLLQGYAANSAGRMNFWLKDGVSYRLRVETADGNVLCDRWPITGSVTPGAGDTYMVKVDSDDAVPGFLSEKLEDSVTVHWNVGDSTIQAEVQEGAGDTYKVKVNTEDATPGFLEDKLADTTDTQFSPTEDGKQLDNIVFQLTGLGSRLNRIKNVGFDFEQGPFPAASNAGGRGISFGRRFVAGVEVDAWVAQGNNGKLYWTSNNDSTRWVISEEDTAVYTAYPSGRAYYGWSCIKFVYVAGTHNCFCWLMGSGDIEQTIVFFEHKPENYNADGTIKASALDSVTYVGSTAGPRTVIDIMQVDTTGGIFLAGDDPRVGYTTDLSTFQLAMTAVDKNIGGFGFDGDITVQAIERDTGVIWRSTSYGVPGTFAKVPSFYLDNVLVSNFPMSQLGGTAAQWGSMFCMYGQWLSVNFNYVAGGIGFIYSDDGIYWYSSKDEATAFYDANNDGLRWFATNAVPNSGTPIFQLIVSMIPVHRRLSLEKGGVVSGPLILREFPNTPFLGTDHRGRIIPGPASQVAGRDALGISTFMGTLLDDEDAATARATIGAANSFADLTSKPTTLSGFGITDAQAALGYTPVNKAGDAMTGSLSTTERFAARTEIACVRALGTTRATASRWSLLSNDETYGASGWIDSGNNLRLAFLMGDGNWTDRYIFGNNGNLNVVAGAIQTAGVTRISSGGAGTLTTLATTGRATVQSLNISGLTGSRMLSLDGSKNVQSLDAAGSRALIGAQAEDADLTAIAALSTTTYGRSLLTQADSAAARSTLGAMQKDVRAAVVQTGSGPTLTLANDDGEVRIICIAATGNTLNIYDTTTANLVTTITLSAGYHTLTISCIPGSGNTYIVQLDAVTSQAVCAGDQTGVLLFRTSGGELYFERISVT